MNLPDYSEYLKQPGMLAFIEQEWKLHPSMHNEHARIVNEVVDKLSIRTVFEWGCGTGELAGRLTLYLIDYTGIDINDDCIESAKRKYQDLYFATGNIRTNTGALHRSDLVISFGFLKHFGLHEWKDIFTKIASFGEYFIFDMPIANETKDDGTEFHHVWKSRSELLQDIADAGFEVMNIVNTFPIEPVFVCKRKAV